MATLKEHGILMSAPMVRAILAGQKTQTRRTVKAQSAECADVWADNGDGTWSSGWRGDGGNLATLETVRAPHGPVGRRLWVREAHQILFAGPERTGHEDWSTGAGLRVSYPATDGRIEYHHDDKGLCDDISPSIHMPRWASRITLEVTRVRVERVGDISEEDAKAEGVEPVSCSCCERSNGGCTDGPMGRCCPCCNGTGIETCAVEMYANLWDEINGAGSLAASPWVWVYDFRRVG